MSISARRSLLLAALLCSLLVLVAPQSAAASRTVAARAWAVDLGAPHQVGVVTARWRDRRRGSYRVQTSLDGRRFHTAARARRRAATVRARLSDRTARFVRLVGRGGRPASLAVRTRRKRTSPLPASLPASTGAHRYVSTAGSDANPGTETRPWRSIQRALERAQPGDRILVRGGTYAGAAGAGPDRDDGTGPSVYASPRGAPGAPITLQPYPGETAIISGFVSLPSAAWFRLTGFVIDGANAPAGAEGVSLGNTYGATPSHVEISYNEIRRFQPTSTHAHGILHYSGTDTALIGNRIHHIGRQTFYDHGIYMKAGSRVVVANNVISDVTGGYGLHIWGDFDDSWVIHNTVYGSAASGFTIGGNGDRGRPDRVMVANNIFAGHGGAADGHQGYAAKEYQPGAGNAVRDNLGWANARSSSFAISASAPAGNRVADPRFANAAARDLRLRPGSAAANAGHDFGLPLDAAGRPRDGRPDLGAYELG